MITINQLIKQKRKKSKKTKRNIELRHCPQRKGICEKVYTQSPRKPNSANRKVAKVKLSTGISTICYIPGEKHLLQNHSSVLVRGGGPKDLAHVNYSLVRGKYDFHGVLDRKSSRSKYGTKKHKS